MQRHFEITELLKILDYISPFELQESWDNSGLNVGSSLVVNEIFIALEATFEVIEQLPCNVALITHHPLIFKPLKRFYVQEYPANLLQPLIQKNITLIALHTNFDKTHLSRLLAQEILGFDEVYSQGYVATFRIELSHIDLVCRIKERLGLKQVFVASPQPFYRHGTLVSGAGASMIDQIQTDCLLSGDMRYHDGMIAKSLGKSIFDIRHYESERFFCQFLQRSLQEQGIQATTLESCNPFICE
ncbi:Nif3-like dinuclear metal center hexameric protein [Helicobacter monodelphidis]|uniref:Nif3-like dinuclear metal center hexameric protein n=1 Tax=Helicobacter sp. 15-1451 TaxID=2004995 RepID=UPI000DCE69B0|nr:Nif3-like dinuclear metal center hexameric protein [Helicobacter sp. 15-1451]RAX57987.1 Nif3-like dinuclear metal center hexameric protein [Helicobacter sp. 15-1451]